MRVRPGLRLPSLNHGPFVIWSSWLVHPSQPANKGRAKVRRRRGDVGRQSTGRLQRRASHARAKAGGLQGSGSFSAGVGAGSTGIVVGGSRLPRGLLNSASPGAPLLRTTCRLPRLGISMAPSVGYDVEPRVPKKWSHRWKRQVAPCSRPRRDQRLTKTAVRSRLT